MKSIKKLLSFILAFAIIFGSSSAVYAVDNSKAFQFELSVNGDKTKQAMPGEIITVVFNLNRTDSTDEFDMYAMQNEIRYDSNFFKLVDGSVLLSEGIGTTEIGLLDSFREVYMNTVSFNGAKKWPAKRLVGSFQLEVIGETGVSKITNEDYLVSTSNGKDSYAATCQDVTVIVTTDCIVNFETNGGSQIESMNARYGETLQRPDNPTRNGYKFVGWYADIDLQIPWDFDSDLVQGNMTLYAKWQSGNAVSQIIDDQVGNNGGIGGLLIAAVVAVLVLLLGLLVLLLVLGKKTVKFETACDMKIKDQKVKKGGYVERPIQPKRIGRTFAGWYKDEARTMRWDFETDKVENNMTLYAKWV